MIGLLEALLSDGSKNVVLMMAPGILSVRRNLSRRARGPPDCGFPDGWRKKEVQLGCHEKAENV